MPPKGSIKSKGKHENGEESKKVQNVAAPVTEAQEIDNSILKREYKKEISALQLLLRHGNYNDDDEIIEKIFLLQAKVLELGKIAGESLDFLNLTEKKRIQLQQAQKLKDIFNLYWYTFRVFTQTTNNGILQLTEEGYTKFHVLVQFALSGNKDVDDALFNATIDYRHDSLAYGVISELEFYDILQNLVEEVITFTDVLYFSAFAWALLDSIADCSDTPPKLRALRKVKCITKLENEASMISCYVKDKKVRAYMTVNSDKLGTFLTSQKRISQRKQGIVLDDKRIEEVCEYLEFFDKNTWKGSGSGASGGGASGGGGDGDSDGESDNESQFDNNNDDNEESGNGNNDTVKNLKKKRLTHLEMLSELDEKWKRSKEIRTFFSAKQQENVASRNSLEVGKTQALEEKLAALREKFYREHMLLPVNVVLSIEERLKKRNQELLAQGKSYLRETIVSFSRRVSNFMVNSISTMTDQYNANIQRVDDVESDDEDDDDGVSGPPMLSKPPAGGGFLKALSQKFFTNKIASDN